MGKILDNEAFLVSLSNATPLERDNLLRNAEPEQLISLFEILYNVKYNPEMKQFISDSKKSKLLLRNIKCFKIPKSKREFKIEQIRKILLKLNKIIPIVLSCILTNVIAYLRDTYL